MKIKSNKKKYYFLGLIIFLTVIIIYTNSKIPINLVINNIDNQKLDNLESLHIVILNNSLLNSNLIGIRNLKNNKYKFIRFNYFTKKIYQNEFEKDDKIGNFSIQEFIYKFTSLKIRNILIDSNNNFYIEPYSMKSPFLYKFKNNVLPEKYKVQLSKSKIIKIKDEWYIDYEDYKNYIDQ